MSDVEGPPFKLYFRIKKEIGRSDICTLKQLHPGKYNNQKIL